MTAISRIDHMDMMLLSVVEMFCDQKRRSRGGVAHHKHIGMHGREIIDGIK